MGTIIRRLVRKFSTYKDQGQRVAQHAARKPRPREHCFFDHAEGVLGGGLGIWGGANRGIA